MKFSVIVFVCLWFSASASAYLCGDRMAQLQTEVKGLALEQRAHVTKDFDAFYLEKPGTAQRVMVFDAGQTFCRSTRIGKKERPPPRYRDLIRSVGHALGFGDDDLGEALETCLNEAEANKTTRRMGNRASKLRGLSSPAAIILVAPRFTIAGPQ